MQIGMIGLGRMGANMARRLTKGGHQCVAFDRNRETVDALAREGPTAAYSLEEVVEKLSAPRAVWIMLPSGAPTEETVVALSKLLQPGDAIIDGGNSFYKDDVRRSAMLKPSGIHYLDAGTSGGVWGLERGYCLMIGGDQSSAQRLDPIFATLAPGPGDIPKTPGREGMKSTAELGYLHCGPSGAGHFVKMIHNGIEYGLMQAYAEGFDILRGANSDNLPAGLSYDLNLADIAELWRRGSVVSSWLLDLTATALASDRQLDRVTRASSKIRAKGVGRSRPRSMKEYRPKCFRLRSTPVSVRARNTPLPRRSSPPCAKVSVATSNALPPSK